MTMNEGARNLIRRLPSAIRRINNCQLLAQRLRWPDHDDVSPRSQQSVDGKPQTRIITAFLHSLASAPTTGSTGGTGTSSHHPARHPPLSPLLILCPAWSHPRAYACSYALRSIASLVLPRKWLHNNRLPLSHRSRDAGLHGAVGRWFLEGVGVGRWAIWSSWRWSSLARYWDDWAFSSQTVQGEVRSGESQGGALASVGTSPPWIFRSLEGFDEGSQVEDDQGQMRGRARRWLWWWSTARASLRGALFCLRRRFRCVCGGKSRALELWLERMALASVLFLFSAPNISLQSPPDFCNCFCSFFSTVNLFPAVSVIVLSVGYPGYDEFDTPLNLFKGLFRSLCDKSNITSGDIEKAIISGDVE
ncbi:hypothetical protein B0H13DRAFT_2581684 [Mycena leptocephala]|nr:hypothetical protein B0H13DRAFT_2581684 [Mycena leptocephala]